MFINKINLHMKISWLYDFNLFHSPYRVTMQLILHRNFHIMKHSYALIAKTNLLKNLSDVPTVYVNLMAS